MFRFYSFRRKKASERNVLRIFLCRANSVFLFFCWHSLNCGDDGDGGDGDGVFYLSDLFLRLSDDAHPNGDVHRLNGDDVRPNSDVHRLNGDDVRPNGDVHHLNGDDVRSNDDALPTNDVRKTDFRPKKHFFQGHRSS